MNATTDDIIEDAIVHVDRGGQVLIIGPDCEFNGASAATPWVLEDVMVDGRQEPIPNNGFRYSAADGSSSWDSYPKKGSAG